MKLANRNSFHVHNVHIVAADVNSSADLVRCVSAGYWEIERSDPLVITVRLIGSGREIGLRTSGLSFAQVSNLAVRDGVHPAIRVRYRECSLPEQDTLWAIDGDGKSIRSGNHERLEKSIFNVYPLFQVILHDEKVAGFGSNSKYSLKQNHRML
jgi:hypothetical protein